MKNSRYKTYEEVRDNKDEFTFTLKLSISELSELMLAENNRVGMLTSLLQEANNIPNAKGKDDLEMLIEFNNQLHEKLSNALPDLRS